MTLDLSVIVPCHNEAQTLPAQLDALTTQRWTGTWEIIVVDNRSTDRTAEVVRSYEDRSVPVRVVSANKRAGIAYARNSGVRATDARSIAFCDGDDVVQPGWTAAMGDALDRSLLVTGTLDGEQLNEPWLARTRPMGASEMLPHFGGIAFTRGNNTGMHRSVWEALGGYDEDFDGLEDIEFSVRAAGAGYEVTLVPAARIAYRFRRGLRSTWRQGIYYGRGRPRMAEQANALGLRAPGRFAGLRSWAWLAVRCPLLATRSGRHAWIFTLAVRWGAVLGAVRTRRIFF